MTDDEATTQPASTPAESAEAAALAAERATDEKRSSDAHERTETPPDEAADKTDMSAVGDDGQVFGG